MPSFLVIQTSFLGDTVLTTALLRELACRGPVDIVTTPASAALLAGHPAVREVIAYDKRGTERGIRGMLRLAARLRARKYAAAFLAQASLRSGAIAFLARIPRRVGFAHASGSRFYTERVLVPADGMHHAERLLRLAIGTETVASREEIRPSLHPGPGEQAAADALLARYGLAPGAFVAVAPGSVWATKRWPYYPALAARLRASGNAAVVVIGGSADGALAAEIRGATAGTVVDATGQLSLLASAALIARAAVLVTNDSSPLHLASAVGTPTVALFGPTVPAFGFGPLAPRAVTIGHPALPCRPCDRHGPMSCPLGHWRCMREVEPELVLESIQALADSPSPS